MKKVMKRMILLVCVIGMLLGVAATVSAAEEPKLIADPYLNGVQFLKNPYGDTNARFTFWIQTELMAFNKEFRIEIYDANGKLVLQPEDFDSYTLWDEKYFLVSVFGARLWGIRCDVGQLATGEYTAHIYLNYSSEGTRKDAAGSPAVFHFSLVNKSEKLNGLALDNAWHPNGYYYWAENGAHSRYKGFAGGNRGVYLSNGYWNTNSKGVFYDDVTGEWKYVDFGLWVTNYSGIAAAEDGTKYYFENGKVNYEAEFYRPSDNLYIKDGIASEGCKIAQGAHEYEKGTCIYCDKPQMTDVKKNTFYYNAVIWALKNEITNGTSETEFSPERGCTRAEVVTLLWRAAGCPEPEGGAESFVDVEAGRWYSKAVQWAVENNITQGKGKGRFAPDETCTRAEIATFLYRTAGCPEVGDVECPFEDVDLSRWYKDAVLWAVEEEITNGTTKVRFSPDGTCTRGHIVTFLYRYYN